MKARSKKFLSLLLATAMVFTLNTTVFAEEVAVDSVDDAVEATVDAVDEVAEEATVDDTNDAVAAAGDGVVVDDGYKYDKDGKLLTTVTYASNGDKKKPKTNIATITNTDDPVSWNNVYAEDMIATILYGGDDQDDWLNNSSKVTVSNANVGDDGKFVYGQNAYAKFEVIPVEKGSQYLLVAYSLENGNKVYVNGHDDSVPTIGNETSPATIFTTEWDGRTIDFNKSGNHKYGKGKKEALDVKVAFVTYSNGTVTEINGVDAGTVKVDKKNQKAASVEYDTALVGKSYVETVAGKDETKTTYIHEHKTLGDLPYFTIKAGVKGSDAKSYKKAIATTLKDKKFYFGITQMAVSVTADYDEGPALSKVIEAVSDNSTVSEGKVTISDNQADTMEEAIAEALVNSAYEDMDVDSYKFNNGKLKITKFNDKGATITLRGYVGDDKSGDWEDLKTISGKGKNAEYSFEDGTVANTTVKVLNFKEGGNFVYMPLTAGITADVDKKVETRNWTDMKDLAPAGFKWAFRKSPVEKSKKFRYGVYKDKDQGFVYSVDETAVDSVEEAF